MSDPVKAIVGALRRSCGPLATLSIAAERSAAWHSLLFDGGRHHVRIALSGENAAQALDVMSCAIGHPEFAIPGHIVADIRLSGIEHDGKDALVSLEALTIRDGDRIPSDRDRA